MQGEQPLDRNEDGGEDRKRAWHSRATAQKHDLEVANEMIQGHGLSGVQVVRPRGMGDRRDHTAGRVE